MDRGEVGATPERATPGLAEPPTSHGGSPPRGLAGVPRSSTDRGRYGRMFRHLPAFAPDDDVLRRLADSMGPFPQSSPSPAPPMPAAPPMTAGSPIPALQPGDNPDIPAGYTYLGQFVDHDITFDPTSVLERRNDPDAVVDFRTPRFDLDSVYGSGPADHPFLYDQKDPCKLLVGRNRGRTQERDDLPRNDQGRALLGDPRNDVHVIVSQLTLAVLRFHNAIVDRLRDRSFPEAGLFVEAQRLTRWHYQWVVVEDYLRRIVGTDVLRRVLVVDPVGGGRRAELAFFTWKREPFMPVEFSAAAYRFGHSQVRATYVLNPDLDLKHIMLPMLNPDPLQHLGGFRPLPKGWKISWDLFFTIDGSTPQLSRRIDTKIVGPFGSLPPALDPDRRPMALLDLLRGKALGLPSGEAVAAAMGTSRTDLGLTGPTPLWYYLLREAEVDSDGVRLGPTGATIVAEVLVGLLAADPSSYLRVAPGWSPELPSAEPGDFTMVDLLRFAGVA
ncbi:MAG: heme peroxidase family protein [Actinomycetota bacterium]|nr:heme peroxidase family protein [Actinomycetota bacterium]